MLKLLAPVFLILLAGGVWWFANNDSAEPTRQGLQQAPLAPEIGPPPGENASLKAPTGHVRERSTELETAPIRPIDVTEGDLSETLPIEVIVPHSTLTVRALVVDWNDQPIRDKDLELGYEPLASSKHIDPSLTNYAVHSDSEGKVQIELGLPKDAPTQIAIWIEDKSRQAKGWVEPVNVIVNGRGDLGTIQIFEAREKYPKPLVQGQVLSAAGKAVPITNSTFTWAVDFNVEISGFSATVLPTRTRESGQVVVMPTGQFQAFGPDNWVAADIVMGSAGHMDAIQNFQTLPVEHVQLILYPAFPIRGQLKVPNAGPPVAEYLVHLAQACGSSYVTPKTDGSFEGLAADQTLTVTVMHRGATVLQGNPNTNLFQAKFPNAASKGSNLGVIDFVNQTQVVDLTLTSLQGQVIRNEDIFMAAPGMQFQGRYHRTDENGRLLTVVPRDITAIQIFRRNRSLPNAQKTVEFLLPASPSKVALP